MIVLRRGRAVLELAKPPYTAESVRLAALLVGARADVFLSEEKDHFLVELAPPEKLKEAELTALAGEFLNECLSSAYRQQAQAAAPEAAQALLAQVLEKGFPAMPPDPLEQLEPQVRLDRDAETAELLREAMKK